MKKLAFITCMTGLLSIPFYSRAQFIKSLTIGQSMATAEQQALPAQFSMTVPEHKKASFVINAGISINLDSLSKPGYLSAITAEFHRNSLTDSVQNNYQIGYKGTFKIGGRAGGNTIYYLTFDPQYSRDQVAQKHSFQSNVLFSWRTTGSALNWNAFNVNQAKTNYYKIGLISGTQIQHVFHSDSSTALRGFKLRPLAIADAGLFFLRGYNKLTDPVFSLNVSFTQRVAAVNTTSDAEKFTHLFRAGINYYIVSTPAKLSLGAEFLSGSDNFTGMKQQQYFLLAFNVFLTKP